MKGIKRAFSIFAFGCIMMQAAAHSDSARLRISLLTCSPGSELYSVFGHSALRIVDSTVGTDIVYNFGTFNFGDPDFYSKFVMGRLMYYVDQETYSSFKAEYEYDRRGIIEQVLSFSCAEKKLIQEKLFINVREENKYYKYDFLNDNCTSRLRDIIFGGGNQQAYRALFATKTNSSYRDYLHVYLDRANMPWTKLGIDLLIGLDGEDRMNSNEAMFLPDYLMKGLSAADWRGGKMVLAENILLPDLQPKWNTNPFFQTPLFFFLLLLVLFIVIGNMKSVRFEKIKKILDVLLFALTGLLGFVLLFTWFGTDHMSFRYNVNLMWAMPLNVVAVFFIGDKNTKFKKYFFYYSILTLFIIPLIFILPEAINPTLYPLIILLSYRAWIIGRNDKKTLKQSL